MSYILEALKKSEQERHRGRTPDLQALHAITVQPVQTRRWWPAVLVLALLLNAALILIWRTWETARPEPVAPPAVIATTPTPPKPMVAPPVLQTQAPRVPQATPSAVAPPGDVSTVTEAPEPATPVQPQESRIFTVSELPPEVRRGIPEMNFDVHLYSVKPTERMVSINGRMLKEGQEVSAGLKLEHITPDGMVFSYQGYTFKRGVF